jgi:hypothetical protein
MDIGSPDERLAALRCEQMLPLVGARFRATSMDGSDWDWILREVRDESRPGARHADEASRRPFSLYFEPVDAPAATQGTYVLASERFAPLPVFLTPVLIEPGRVWMQAVFH